jgi:hypothetical protein
LDPLLSEADLELKDILASVEFGDFLQLCKANGVGGGPAAVKYVHNLRDRRLRKLNAARDAALVWQSDALAALLGQDETMTARAEELHEHVNRILAETQSTLNAVAAEVGRARRSAAEHETELLALMDNKVPPQGPAGGGGRGGTPGVGGAAPTGSNAFGRPGSSGGGIPRGVGAAGAAVLSTGRWDGEFFVIEISNDPPGGRGPVSFLIGHRGASIQPIEDKCGARVQVEKSTENVHAPKRQVWISAPTMATAEQARSACERCAMMVAERMDEYAQLEANKEQERKARLQPNGGLRNGCMGCSNMGGGGMGGGGMGVGCALGGMGCDLNGGNAMGAMPGMLCGGMGAGLGSMGMGGSGMGGAGVVGSDGGGCGSMLDGGMGSSGMGCGNVMGCSAGMGGLREGGMSGSDLGGGGFGGGAMYSGGMCGSPMTSCLDGGGMSGGGALGAMAGSMLGCHKDLSCEAFSLMGSMGEGGCGGVVPQVGPHSGMRGGGGMQSGGMQAAGLLESPQQTMPAISSQACSDVPMLCAMGSGVGGSHMPGQMLGQCGFNGGMPASDFGPMGGFHACTMHADCMGAGGMAPGWTTQQQMQQHEHQRQMQQMQMQQQMKMRQMQSNMPTGLHSMRPQQASPQMRPQPSLLSSRPSNTCERHCIEHRMPVPACALGLVIGRGGENIHDIRAKTNATAHIEQNDGPGDSTAIIMAPNGESLQRAIAMIEAHIDRARQNQARWAGGRPHGAPGRQERPPPSREAAPTRHSEEHSYGGRPCSNCGQTGHLTRECRETRRDGRWSRDGRGPRDDAGGSNSRDGSRGRDAPGVRDNGPGPCTMGDSEIVAWVMDRERARLEHNCERADSCRVQMRAAGITVDDMEHLWLTTDGRSGRIPPYDDRGRTGRKVRCDYCNDDGHVSRDCPRGLGGGAGGDRGGREGARWQRDGERGGADRDWRDSGGAARHGGAGGHEERNSAWGGGRGRTGSRRDGRDDHHGGSDSRRRDGGGEWPAPAGGQASFGGYIVPRPDR